MSTHLPSSVRMPELARLLDSAAEIASHGGADRVGADHVLLALLRDPGAIPSKALLAMGLHPSLVMTRLAEFACREIDADPAGLPASAHIFPTTALAARAC
ncbi:Clp protease N-terminal domain-containing protein [Nocardia sp. NPDC051030]|uniref:Clp protease N-terminal domain-containing protein n=1 Tax=Nocardia sp. NPDC051030 TaxID=3155162 RepID=UPI00341A5FB4